MKLVTIVVFISFILEGFISQYINMDSALFIPLLTIISLIIIYPYFNNNNRSFIYTTILTGFIYDIVYTNTILLNSIVFLLIGFIIILLNETLSNTKFNVLIMSLIIIIAYRVITYIIIVLITYRSYDFELLKQSITSSILLNLIYAFILFWMTDFISKKYNILKID